MKIPASMKRRFETVLAASAFMAMLGNALTTSAVVASSVTDWPTLSHDPHHSGYMASPTPNSAVASTLGPNWMANLYAADLGSPVAR